MDKGLLTKIVDPDELDEEVKTSWRISVLGRPW